MTETLMAVGIVDPCNTGPGSAQTKLREMPIVLSDCAY